MFLCLTASCSFLIFLCSYVSRPLVASLCSYVSRPLVASLCSYVLISSFPFQKHKMRSWGVPAVVCAVVMVVVGCAEGHTHHLHNTNKEREADGARSPRDHQHYEGGEHHVEFDHEAILGSTKDAEEYDQLAPPEAKRRLEVLLLKMDRNNDKTIDRTELHSWILRSFR
ncbi:Reticulocalbin-2 [Chionoecetes opilio]|uniref:Reticulocalbin-2 n=1 Tax=Chionoecetes opilio TaxID=41210 RepID=A0A8J4XY37_CHIOP|nr:Reticulocalbin-2 [Chionoecetes opilio]